MAKNLKIVFLGGVGEIGKNMTALEFGNEIIVVDAGLGFPTEDMPGIDLVVQDITYLIKPILRSPTNFAGAFLNTNSHVGEPLMPILFSTRRTITALSFLSYTK